VLQGRASALPRADLILAGGLCGASFPALPQRLFNSGSVVVLCLWYSPLPARPADAVRPSVPQGGLPFSVRLKGALGNGCLLAFGRTLVRRSPGGSRLPKVRPATSPAHRVRRFRPSLLRSGRPAYAAHPLRDYSGAYLSFACFSFFLAPLCPPLDSVRLVYKLVANCSQIYYSEIQNFEGGRGVHLRRFWTEGGGLIYAIYTSSFRFS